MNIDTRIYDTFYKISGRIQEIDESDYYIAWDDGSRGEWFGERYLKNLINTKYFLTCNSDHEMLVLKIKHG